MTRHISTYGTLLAALALVALAQPSQSETAEDFYRGKQINLIIGYNPGGPYDVYSRLAATLLPKYIPGNPKIVPQNMPGVGSAKAANYLYSQAPRDGLTLGVIGQQLPVSQALGDASVKFDIRQFNWLGRFTSGAEATVVWHTSPTKTIADAMKRETTLASTSAALLRIIPTVDEPHRRDEIQNDPGHRGVTGTVLAMERGETEGAHATLEQIPVGKQDWLKQKTAAVLIPVPIATPGVPGSTGAGRIRQDRPRQEGSRTLAAPPKSAAP
jgi:hypothetical protein